MATIRFGKKNKTTPTVATTASLEHEPTPAASQPSAPEQQALAPRPGVLVLAKGEDLRGSPWVEIAYAFLIYLATQFVAAVSLYAYAHARGWDKSTTNYWLNTVPAQFWYVLLAETLTFGAIAWFISKRGQTLRLLGLVRFRLSDIWKALVGLGVYFGIYILLYSFASHLPGINVNQSQDLGFNDVQGSFKLVLTFISLVILPPLVEETMFRGFIFRGMRSKLRFVPAAIFTSLLFASAHLELGSGKPLLWIATLDTFTLSMVLCFLREKTGSLWPGILVHSLKNLVAFLSLFVFMR